MGSKKKTTQVSNSTSTAAPPSWTQPGFEAVSGQLMNAINGPKAPAYTGDFVAAPDAGLTQQAIDQYLATAGKATDLSGFLESQLAPLMARNDTRYDVGDYNSTLAPAIEAAMAPVFRNLTEKVLPGIRSSATDSGAYSGSRAMAVLPGMAMDAASRNAQEIGAGMAFEDYQAREARRLDAYKTDEQLALERTGMLPALIDNILKSSAGGAQMTEGALNLGQARDQSVINNNLAKHDYAVKQPFEGMDIATQLLQALSGNYGTTTNQGKTVTTEKTGGLGSVVQGALGLASMAASMGAFGPLAGAAGAAAGGAGGAAGALGMGLPASRVINPWGG